MIKEFSFSEFPIIGMEVDDYCLSFFDTYGENSEVCKAIDAEYSKSKSVDGTWVGFWNELRKNLCKDGFEEEVMEQDKIFIEKTKKELEQVSKFSGKTVAELRKNYIPMRKRWEMDEAAYKEMAKGK